MIACVLLCGRFVFVGFVSFSTQSSTSQPSAQIMYPAMQCADVFFLGADICQLGMDQRKVNMLAREYCDQIGKKDKPIILSHHMLMGLLQGQEKMSKSVAGSAIFMEDSAVCHAFHNIHPHRRLCRCVSAHRVAPCVFPHCCVCVTVDLLGLLFYRGCHITGASAQEDQQGFLCPCCQP